MTDNIWTDIVSVGDLVKIEVNALWRDRPTVWRKVKSIRTDRDGDQCRSWPWSLLHHCRTMVHVAQGTGYELDTLRAAVRRIEEEIENDS